MSTYNITSYPIASGTCAHCGATSGDIGRRGWASTECAGILCNDCYESLRGWRDPMLMRHADEYQKALRQWIRGGNKKKEAK